MIPPERFAIAWPGAERTAEGLTWIWLERFKSEHTRYNYARDLTAWLAWCEACRITPANARIAHVDLWIRKQLDEHAADASVVRRISGVSSWYKYMIANTADDPVPLAVRNPTVGCARPDIDQDYSPTVGLSQAEAVRGRVWRGSPVAWAVRPARARRLWPHGSAIPSRPCSPSTRT